MQGGECVLYYDKKRIIHLLWSILLVVKYKIVLQNLGIHYAFI
jgi:hypothetical protein